MHTLFRAPVVVAAGLLLLVPAVSTPRAQQATPSNAAVDAAASVVLAPTAHPPVPNELSAMWLAPERGAGTAAASPGTAALVSAARLTGQGEYTRALTQVSQALDKDGPLPQYAAFYAGRAQLGLKRFADALRSFRGLEAQRPVGYLAEAAPLGEAEALEALGSQADAVRIYERLLTGRVSDAEAVYMRLGRAAKAAGDGAKAAEAFGHVFYEFPAGENAAAAGEELNALTGLQPLAAGSERYTVELRRAERLFAAKQYADARAAFTVLSGIAPGADSALIRLRLAECEYFQKRARAATDLLKPLTEEGPFQAEALFHVALATRDAGDKGAFVALLDRVQREFPGDRWAEDALDALADYYLKSGDDDRADEYFRQIVDRYPRSAPAERAAWKAGWTSYRAGQYADTIRMFERAAANFPRSDYRPAWLYWTGRAHEQLGDTGGAEERYLLEIADYRNSYYGRLALERVDASASARAVAVRNTVAARAQAVPAPPPNGAVIRALLGAGLYDAALDELRYAQRVWGNSPAIEATQAWTSQQQARAEGGTRRFQLLRGGINTMRRAYPQFLAAGGEDLPRDVLTVIFPMAYWDLIQKHAAANDLDPFLVAALVAQESTFVADIKSYANAYGLMQLLPSTARQYARKLKMPYSSRLLVDPEANIRMGTAYLADKLREFGGVHLALASYNAGERAVHRWQNERPDVEVAEFIDDIPYPQTQNYVKRILGTADDYRRIYGGVTRVEGLETTAPSKVPAAAASAPPAPRRASSTVPSSRPPAGRAPARKPAAQAGAPRSTPADATR